MVRALAQAVHGGHHVVRGPTLTLSTTLTLLVLLQGVATILLLRRLLPGMYRPPAVPPHAPFDDATVSVIVPTLNEAKRVLPCLEGLSHQQAPMLEVIVVDSGSSDGTQRLIEQHARHDHRVRLERDPPLPPGWIGKAWALQHGVAVARGEWILGLDADTQPNDGCVAGALAAARAHAFDLVSFSPRFAGQSTAERFLQPALLASLVFRMGAPGTSSAPDRLLANGQCFLVRRAVLLAHGGFAPARDSYAEDVRLARHYARAGVRCGFLDGHLLYDVRSYESARQMWREWGRSIDLSDATSRMQQGTDLALLVLTQALPLPLLLIAFLWHAPVAVVGLNVLLLAVRAIVLLSFAPSYAKRGLPFFASPLADPAAVLRVIVSTFRRPSSWRGRIYGHRVAGTGGSDVATDASPGAPCP